MKLLLLTAFILSTNSFAQTAERNTSSSPNAVSRDQTENEATPQEQEEERERSESMGGAPNAGVGTGTGTGAGSTVGKKIKSEGTITAGETSGDAEDE